MEFRNLGLQPPREKLFLAKPNKIPMDFREVMISQQIRQIVSNMDTGVHICLTEEKREIPGVTVNFDFQKILRSPS